MHSTSDSRTKRLLDLVVLLLDARRPISFAELREQFSEYRSAKPEAGQRAYERDKSTLLEMGVPLRYVTAEESADAPAEGGYILAAQILTAFYFVFFLVILPLLGLFETPRPLPASIADDVLAKHGAH